MFCFYFKNIGLVNLNIKCFLKWPIKFSLIASLIWVVLACSEKQTREEHVKARATERWQALIAGKIDDAYTFLTPEYRQLYTSEQYGRGITRGGFWDKVDVIKVECADNCIVTVRIHVKMKVPRSQEAIVTTTDSQELWMPDKDSGEWYFFDPDK